MLSKKLSCSGITRTRLICQKVYVGSLFPEDVIGESENVIQLTCLVDRSLQHVVSRRLAVLCHLLDHHDEHAETVRESFVSLLEIFIE